LDARFDFRWCRLEGGEFAVETTKEVGKKFVDAGDVGDRSPTDQIVVFIAVMS